MGVTVPAQYQPYINQAAQATGLPASVVAAQIQTESGYNPNAVSPAGAEGIAQFLPGTFASYGSGSPFNVADAFNAYENYMSALLKEENGNITNALAAYNAGPGNLSAGMGYATSILSLAGQPGGGTASGGTGGNTAAGATDETAGWLQNLFGWFTGIGPLEGSGGSGSLTGALGSGIEQGLFNAFWDVFKKIFDTLMKPIFWLIEVNWGVMLMLAGLIILLQGTKAGQLGTSLLAAVPGPVGFVGKGAAVMGGVRGVRSGARAELGPTSAERTTAELERRSDRAASRRLSAPHRSKTYYSSGPDQNRAVRRERVTL